MESKHSRLLGVLRTGLTLPSTYESHERRDPDQGQPVALLDPGALHLRAGPEGLLSSCTAKLPPEARMLHAGMSAWARGLAQVPLGPLSALARSAMPQSSLICWRN